MTIIILHCSAKNIHLNALDACYITMVGNYGSSLDGSTEEERLDTELDTDCSCYFITYDDQMTIHGVFFVRPYRLSVSIIIHMSRLYYNRTLFNRVCQSATNKATFVIETLAVFLVRPLNLAFALRRCCQASHSLTIEISI